MLGQYIQKLREEKKISQEHIAKKLGISRQTYILLEKEDREITISEAKKIAEILNVTFMNLITQNETVEIVKVEEHKKKNRDENILRISIPKKNMDKLKEILLYILTKVGAKPNVGETVLYKLLYFIDFDYYEKYEEQLIGATYIKNHYGPTPVEFKTLIEKMVKSGDVEIINSKYFKHEQKKYLAIRSANLGSLLSAQEIKHIDEVLDRLSDKNANELSDYSHQDIPWISTEEGKVIDYESVFYRLPKTSVRNYE